MMVPDLLSRVIFCEPRCQHFHEVITAVADHCSANDFQERSMPSTEEFISETSRLHRALLNEPLDKTKWTKDEDGVLSTLMEGKSKVFVPISLRKRVLWHGHGAQSAGHHSILKTILGIRP